MLSLRVLVLLVVAVAVVECGYSSNSKKGKNTPSKLVNLDSIY